MRGLPLSFKNISFSKRIIRPRVLVPFFLILFLSVGIFLMPSPAFASWWNPADWVRDYLSDLIIGVAYLIYMLGVGAVKLGVLYNSFLMGNSAVVAEWGTMRDFTLGVFGMFVIIIALMNILKIKIEEWGVAKLIPKLVFAAFLVIMSRYICMSILNFANALTNALTASLSGNIYGIFDHLGSLFQNFCKADSCDASTRMNAAFLALFVAFIALIFLLILAIVMFIRVIMLIFLVIVSPLAFALIVLPWTSKYFSEWWKMLIKWTFFYPISMFIFAIGVSLSQNLQGDKQVTAAVAMVLPTILPTNSTDFVNLLVQFSLVLIALVIIPLAVILPLKLLGAVGSAASNGLSGMLTGKNGIPGLGKYSPKAARDWVGARTKRANEMNADKFNKMMRKPFTNKKGELSKFGQWANKMNPEMMKAETVKAGKDFSNANIDKGLHGAYFRMLMNPGRSKQKMDYENALMKAAGIDESEIAENRELALERAKQSVQGKFLTSFTQKHGETFASQAALSSMLDKGFVEGKTEKDEGVQAVYSKNDLFQSAKQSQKRHDHVDKDIRKYSALDLNGLNDDALDVKYSDLNKDLLADADYGLTEGFANNDRLSTHKKGQLYELYQATAEHHSMQKNKFIEEAETARKAGDMTKAAEATKKAQKAQERIDKSLGHAERLERYNPDPNRI